MLYKSIFNAVVVAVVAVVFLMAFGVYAQTKGAPSVSTFKDSRDGKTYKTVNVDGKTWMAENLNFAAKGSVCYDNKDDNCAKYGRMYNWATVQKACPAGWHLPSDDEWTTLVDYAGGEETAGTKLKSTRGWNDHKGGSGNGTDDLGFSALPGGYVISVGSAAAGDYGCWWSATVQEDNANFIWYRRMYSIHGKVARSLTDKVGMSSVRCVQD